MKPTEKCVKLTEKYVKLIGIEMCESLYTAGIFYTHTHKHTQTHTQTHTYIYIDIIIYIYCKGGSDVCNKGEKEEQICYLKGIMT